MSELNRSSYSGNVKIKNKKRIYKTVLFPRIKTSDNDIYIITKSGDRLDYLAKQYYNDETKWRIIAHANHIKGTIHLDPEMQIRIPMDINEITENLKNLNEV